MKVRIDRNRDGWRYHNDEGIENGLFGTYAKAVNYATAAGYEIDNAGWRHRLLSWNFNNHALDGYPGWEIESERSPAFVRLAHARGVGEVESHRIAAAWDDVAKVDFYQRDWTEDGLPFVGVGDTYWSGWWFATIEERDRFNKWNSERRHLIDPF